MLLSYPLFNSIIIAIGAVYPLIFLVTILSLMALLLEVKKIKAAPWHILLWCVLLIMVTINSLSYGVMSLRTAAFIILSIGMVPLIFSQKNRLCALNIVIMYTVAHAFTTIIFFINEELCDTFKNTFYPNNPDYQGYICGLTSHYSFNGMILASGLIFSSAKVLWTKNAFCKVDKISVLLTVVIGIALLLTTKRGVVVIGACSIFIMYLAFSRFKLNKILVGLLTLITLFVLFIICAPYVPGLDELYNRLFGTEYANSIELTSGRVYLWDYALKNWESSPLIGIGWGNFIYKWTDLRYGTISVAAHNIYLQLLAEGGLVLLLAFLSVQISTLLLTVRQILLAQRIQQNMLMLCGSFGYQVYFLIYGFIGNPLFDLENAILYVLACALVYGCKVDFNTVKKNEQ